jgi:hypothetical protein
MLTLPACPHPVTTADVADDAVSHTARLLQPAGGGEVESSSNSLGSFGATRSEDGTMHEDSKTLGSGDTGSGDTDIQDRNSSLTCSGKRKRRRSSNPLPWGRTAEEWEALVRKFDNASLDPSLPSASYTLPSQVETSSPGASALSSAKVPSGSTS